MTDLGGIRTGYMLAIVKAKVREDPPGDAGMDSIEPFRMSPMDEGMIEAGHKRDILTEDNVTMVEEVEIEIDLLHGIGVSIRHHKLDQGIQTIRVMGGPRPSHLIMKLVFVINGGVVRWRGRDELVIIQLETSLV